MAILNILTVGNDAGTLAEKAEDLTKSDILSHKIQTLIEDMKDTCHSVGGLGLAANQVGSPANLFIYKVPGETGYKVLINPVVLWQKDKFTSKGESCLSLPDRQFNVKRYKKIRIGGLDENGNGVDIPTKSKQLAKILQHELDHLNGQTILDKGKEI